MRRLILMISALLVLARRRSSAERASRPRSRSRTLSRPRGSRSGRSNTVYVGSVGTGAVWVGDLRTGSGRILVEGAPGVRSATGLELERDRLWVSGARFGNARVYDASVRRADPRVPAGDRHRARPSSTMRSRPRRASTSPTRNDPSSTGSRTLDGGHDDDDSALGDYKHVVGQFNLNGIVATENGKTLIAVQSSARKLFTIDPRRASPTRSTWAATT